MASLVTLNLLDKEFETSGNQCFDCYLFVFLKLKLFSIDCIEKRNLDIFLIFIFELLIV